MDHLDLIRTAETKLNRRVGSDGRLHGDVASAVLGKNGNVYVGVCVDTPGWGLCAERSALAAMITDGEYAFTRIVAVWRDEKSKKLAVLPPCGHCRQFMRDINEHNLDSEIVLGRDHVRALRELIPHHSWPDFLDKQ